MFVTAKLNIPAFEALTIPQRITNRGLNGDLTVLLVNQDNIIETRSIKASKVSGDSWVVEEGLSEGDILVYEGFQKIRDGMKVNPIRAKKVEEER